MLDKIILATAESVSYSHDEMSNIASSSNHLRDIIKNHTDFKSSFIGGSYQRKTMVKGISDVDIYYQYTGVGRPQAALDILKNCLSKTYSDSEIKQDKPSILASFRRIPFNITPYKKDTSSTTISIPSNDITSWRPINITPLETGVIALRGKNPQYGHLIKVLKLWNNHHDKKMKNYEVEQRVVGAFNSGFPHTQPITSMLQSFFKFYSLQDDSVKLVDLIGKASRLNEGQLRAEWLRYIENKK